MAKAKKATEAQRQKAERYGRAYAHGQRDKKDGQCGLCPPELFGDDFLMSAWFDGYCGKPPSAVFSAG